MAPEQSYRIPVVGPLTTRTPTTYFEPANPRLHERIGETGEDTPSYCLRCGAEYMQHDNARCPAPRALGGRR